jgi:hypothetical protein
VPLATLGVRVRTDSVQLSSPLRSCHARHVEQRNAYKSTGVTRAREMGGASSSRTTPFTRITTASGTSDEGQLPRAHGEGKDGRRQRQHGQQPTPNTDTPHARTQGARAGRTVHLWPAGRRWGHRRDGCDSGRATGQGQWALGRALAAGLFLLRLSVALPLRRVASLPRRSPVPVPVALSQWTRKKLLRPRSEAAAEQGTPHGDEDDGEGKGTQRDRRGNGLGRGTGTGTGSRRETARGRNGAQRDTAHSRSHRQQAVCLHVASSRPHALSLPNAAAAPRRHSSSSSMPPSLRRQCHDRSVASAVRSAACSETIKKGGR